MSVMRAAEATAYDTHGNRFLSYVSPARGSSELCAWTLAVPAGQRGVAHRPTREEVLLVLDGTMDITLDGVPSSLAAETSSLVGAGTELRAGGSRGASSSATRPMSSPRAGHARLHPARSSGWRCRCPPQGR